jgi:DNA-binding response OmpR family regulator
MVELEASESPVPFLAAPMRILVVEDDFLLADMLARLLEEHGVVVVGPVAAREEALKLASAERLDGAMLDIRLGRNSDTFPVAETLAGRGVPFIFMTAYDDSVLPASLAGRPLLTKPLDPSALPDILEEHFGA